MRDVLTGTGSSARLVWDNPNLRRLNLSLLGSTIGDGAYATALAVYAFQWGGAGALGVFVAIKLALKALTVPFGVAVADRLQRRAALVGIDALRAALVTAVALLVLADGPPLLVLVIAGVTGVVGAPYRPVSAAMTPSLVTSPRELTAANGVGSTVENVAVVVGPALGGLLLAVTSIPVVFAFDVVSFVWSALLVLGLRTRRAGVTRPTPEPDDDPSGLVAEAMAGFRTVWSDRRLRLVTGLACLETAVAGACAVYVVVAAVQLVHLGESGVGYLNGLVGAGAVVGGVVALGRSHRTTRATDFGAGMLLSTVPLLVVGVAPGAVVACAVFFVLGLGNPLVDVNLRTLLQRLAPQPVLGRVLAAVESATCAGIALGALVVPVLLAALGPAWGVVALVLPVAAVTLVCLPALRRLDHTLRPPALLDLVQGQPLFANLPPATQELVATRLRRLVLPAGTRVIETGAVGEEFYVIGSGRLDAVRGDERLSVMGPGDCFGEIALLRDVPRTATVVAVEDVVLYALGRVDFLGAVGADPETAARADLLVRSRIDR